MSKPAEEDTEKKKVKLDETGKRQGTKLKKKIKDWRQKRWGKKIKNMRQGTKKVRSVTEEKIQREEAEIGCPWRKGTNTCGEKDKEHHNKEFHCPVNSLRQWLSCNDLTSSVNTDRSHDGILLLKAFLICLNTRK